MNLPSTEELQRILDEAKKTGALPLSLQRGSGCVLPNGEYEHGKLFDNDGWEVGEGIGNALGELFLVAPYLAAEVIRLREENQRMQERVNKHAQDALRLTKFLHDHHPVVHAEFKPNLARILEGDQA